MYKIIFMKPKELLQHIKQVGIKRYFVDNVLKSDDSPQKKTLSIALGVFIGLTPFWGFQGILTLTLAVIFKLNKTISFVFSNISIPPITPFVLYGSLKLGSYILGTEVKINFSNLEENFKLIMQLKEYFIGSFVLAIVCSLLFSLLAYIYFILKTKS